MHFSKTYSQLLLTLPQELQDNAIEYRQATINLELQLKKLINKVVLELSSLGLSPAVLHDLLHSCEQGDINGKGKERQVGERPDDGGLVAQISEAGPSRQATKAVYEFVEDGGRIEPRLRLWVSTASIEDDAATASGSSVGAESDDDPRVAIFLDKPESKPPSPDSDNVRTEELLLVSKPVAQKGQSLVWSLQKKSGPIFGSGNAWDSLVGAADSDDSLETLAHPVELVRKQVPRPPVGSREIIIPLTSDTAFFQLLQGALQSLTVHLDTVKAGFIHNLQDLSTIISKTARPRSSVSHSFKPASSFSDPSSISAGHLMPKSLVHHSMDTKSDLYAWREIFQLYIDSEVFESLSERSRGERSLDETERRLSEFAERVSNRGLGDSRGLKLKESREALEKFLQLNLLILNLKKFQYANSEAARKILKKHAKRTALPIPSPFKRLDIPASTLSGFMGVIPDSSKAVVLAREKSYHDTLSLLPTTTASLPHILVQAIGETLIPIIPHIDDYSCLICTSIAFKPIRLTCGHLFCVRCLVKMQKRGQDHCPCCRAPSVLKANRANVDWALLNFMQDWFPVESEEKLRQNEREAAKEELEELGLGDSRCIIM
ncbi:hypothetical protein SCHPADRAFT_826021 [Schizopora paradoxa]|uniref:RING-14 protein n=1 Tax=Schizopora paradoxa TaxID=27342 RepID=A0A0H2RS55_9AGAM|nr:hypothetical protein SCHPADRAFT_826021 [Schizopora paradoxa]